MDDGLMSELDEWRIAVSDMTEMERAATESDCRRTLGMCGDREDVL